MDNKLIEMALANAQTEGHSKAGYYYCCSPGPAVILNKCLFSPNMCLCFLMYFRQQIFYLPAKIVHIVYMEPNGRERLYFPPSLFPVGPLVLERVTQAI